MKYETIRKAAVGALVTATVAVILYGNNRINDLENKLFHLKQSTFTSDSEVQYLELHKSPDQFLPLYTARIVSNPLDFVNAYDDHANRPLMEQQTAAQFSMDQIRRRSK